MAGQMEVAAEVEEEAGERGFAGAPVAGVGVAHVAGEEDFVEDEAAFFFAGGISWCSGARAKTSWRSHISPEAKRVIPSLLIH